MSRSRLGSIVLVLLAVAAPAEAGAQQPTTQTGQQSAPPTTGAVIAKAPINTPGGGVSTAEVGTTLLIIGEQGDWWQVEFDQPPLGRRVGWIQKKFVKIVPTASGAVSPVASEPPRPATTPPPQQAVPPQTTSSAAPVQSDTESRRKGFTMLLNLGLGFQHDVGVGETGGGLAGLNLGLGGFLNEHVALMGRFSGTNAVYDSLDFNQLSGVLGATVQYWPSDTFHIEGGVGMGYWDYGGLQSDVGLGLILGAGVTVFHKGKHYLLVGAEYAPVFTDSDNIHNFGITFGYQFHR